MYSINLGYMNCYIITAFIIISTVRPETLQRAWLYQTLVWLVIFILTVTQTRTTTKTTFVRKMHAVSFF